MEHRHFFVALGVPRGMDTASIEVAYRKIVTRYRDTLHNHEEEGLSTEQILSFSVLRTYSERRHAALMEQSEDAAPHITGEVDRFFGGHIPEVNEEKRRARVADKDLYVEMRLSPDEARAGGIFPVHIPVVRACIACDEQSEESRLVCKACEGSGRITEDRMIEVTVPPGVQHDQRARVAMQDVGLGHTDLIVHVLVG